jgi:hypothetical protein
MTFYIHFLVQESYGFESVRFSPIVDALARHFWKPLGPWFSMAQDMYYHVYIRHLHDIQAQLTTDAGSEGSE